MVCAEADFPVKMLEKETKFKTKYFTVHQASFLNILGITFRLNPKYKELL